MPDESDEPRLVPGLFGRCGPGDSDATLFADVPSITDSEADGLLQEFMLVRCGSLLFVAALCCCFLLLLFVGAHDTLSPALALTVSRLPAGP